MGRRGQEGGQGGPQPQEEGPPELVPASVCARVGRWMRGWVNKAAAVWCEQSRAVHCLVPATTHPRATARDARQAAPVEGAGEIGEAADQHVID